MANGKLDITRYQNVGGINEKGSDHTTGIAQFLNLVNLDFQIPGSLRKRDGSTQAISIGTSGYVTGLHEFIKSSGASQILAAANQNLFMIVGAGLTNLPVGPSPLWQNFNEVGSTFRITNNSRWSFTTLNDNAWICNGEQFVRWDGSTLYNWYAKYPSVSGLSLAIGASGFFTSLLNPGGAGIPAIVSYAFSFQYNNGATSPVNDGVNWVVGVSLGAPGASTISFKLFVSDYSLVVSQGVSALTVWRSVYAQTLGQSLLPSQISYYRLMQLGMTSSMDDFGSGYTFVDTFGNTSLINGPQAFYKTSTQGFNPDFTTSGPVPNHIYSANPKFVDKFNNSLAMAGWTNAKSALIVSEIGDPQHIEADYEYQVNQDDGDQIRGIKSFGTELVVYKEFSMHRFFGDDHSNYARREITNQFGGLNHWSIVLANGALHSLDRQGIVRYDGANYVLISEPMVKTFQRMNIEAAKLQATAGHDLLHKEIWFSFPIDGATLNNTTVVYDYQANTLRKNDGVRGPALSFMKGPLSKANMWQGSYSGMIHYYGPSFMGDNGQGITCTALTRFEVGTGFNHTHLWRQFFLDIEPQSGSTNAIEVSFFKNYDQVTGITSRTFYHSTFQQKCNFGIDSKSIAAQIVNSSATLPLEIKSFSWAYRKLRDE